MNATNGPKPPASDAAILALVKYASPEEWGCTPEQVLLGRMLVSMNAASGRPIVLLAWPDGVRAMLPSYGPLGSPAMDRAVVKTYRAAARVGPVAVGEVS